MSGTGISFVEYRGNKKIYAVSIDSFYVERARLGPFAFGPLRIAHLHKVKIDLYLDEIEPILHAKKSRDASAAGGAFDLESAISNIKRNLRFQAKQIKGIKLKDISLRLWKDEKRVFRISSDTATVDRKTGDIIFTGHAMMDAGQNGNLVSYRIKWNRKTNLFSIRDPYIFTKGNQRIEGTGMETDYLFSPVRQQNLNKQS